MHRVEDMLVIKLIGYRGAKTHRILYFVGHFFKTEPYN